MQGLFGAILLIAIAWLFSESRSSISWTKVIRLIGCQIILMICFLKISLVQKGFLFFNDGINVFRGAVLKGTSFVFGYVGGGAPPFVVDTQKGSTFIFMFQALPMIVVLSAISMLLFHWRILPAIVKCISGIAQKLWKIGGALSTAMAAKLFFGQTDAPLLVRPYLAEFSRNELFSVMTAGMATTSMTLFVLFTTLLEKSLGGSQALTHIVASTVINIPASLAIAELLIPERNKVTQGKLKTPYAFTSSMQAIAQGTTDGWTIMWSIGAMLIVAFAFVEIVNVSLGFVTSNLFGTSIQLETILGYLLWPLIWCMGIPPKDAFMASSLLSVKIIFNEVVAFVKASGLSAKEISPRSLSILTYALCSFGNISSIAIQVAGFGEMIPMRKLEIDSLVPRALFASLLAGVLSSALVSLVI